LQSYGIPLIQDRGKELDFKGIVLEKSIDSKDGIKEDFTCLYQWNPEVL